METTNKHGKGGSAFLWGLILGALIATLITTKRGRVILREVINIALELLETFIEEQTRKSQKTNTSRPINENIDEIAEELEPETEEFQQAAVDEASEDIESGITEGETPPPPVREMEAEAEPKTNGNGHHKKRLFRGLRKSN